MTDHPIDSGDPQRLIDYMAGRHDEREYGQSAAYQRGRCDAQQEQRERDAQDAIHMTRAAAIVHGLARRPVVTPEALWATPGEMTAELAERDRLRAEQFRAAARATRARLKLQAPLGVAS